MRNIAHRNELGKIVVLNQEEHIMPSQILNVLS